MGDLFLATHERLPMKLVVKMLNPALINDQSLLQFRQEAFVLARLQHPNIVQIIDFNWTEFGLPFLVMEYLPGCDLAVALEVQRSRGCAHVMALLQQIASGLFAAHQCGVVHRDLKPKNIMIVPCEGRREVVKIIDFGVSTASRLRQTEADEADIAGTPEFMAPEQVSGDPTAVGPASDQFSLAVLAYLMVYGRLPWTGAAPADPWVHLSGHSHASDEAALESVDAVLLRALAKDPLDRYPSTLTFARALRQAMTADGLLSEGLSPQRTEAEEAVPAAEDTQAPESMQAPQAMQDMQAASDDQADAPAPGSAQALSAEYAQVSQPAGEPDPAPPFEALPEEHAEELQEESNHGLRGPRRSRRPASRRWAPLLLGASLGAMVGLVSPWGPWGNGPKAESVWKRVHVGVSHAAEVVVDEGRQVLGRFAIGSGPR